ncbi:HNH endonuclease [Bacillus cabrialesii subsp. cabrialesii]
MNGHTWHHHQDPGRMQLVDQKVHRKTGHTGGRHLWGGGSKNR